MDALLQHRTEVTRGGSR